MWVPDSWGDVAAMVGILATVATGFAWIVRAWLRQEMNKITPHLTNGDVSVARYAHEARDAANEAREASYEARDAALDAKEAAQDVRDLIRKGEYERRR